MTPEATATKSEQADSVVDEYDSARWRDARNELLLKWMCGSRDAAVFLVDLSAVIETWDDLIDHDRDVSDKDINRAFVTSLYGLNANPFFVANRVHLLPLLMTAINAWLDSVEMERSGDNHERMWSFFLKDYGRELFIQCAFLTGGYEHMREVSMDMRRFFTHETYDTWEHRHDHPKQA